MKWCLLCSAAAEPPNEGMESLLFFFPVSILYMKHVSAGLG